MSANDARPQASPTLPDLNTATSIGGPSEFEAERRDFEPQSPVHNDYDGQPLEKIPTSQDTLQFTGNNGEPQHEALSAVQSERRGSKEVISFLSNDPEHPNNWPARKKMLVFIGGIMSVINSTLGSSLPANAVVFIVEDFGVTDDLQFALPISCFLMGYVHPSAGFRSFGLVHTYR